MLILNEVKKYIENNFYFTSPTIGGKIKKLNDQQIQFLNSIIKNKKLIVLKERQTGISTFALFYSAYRAISSKEPIKVAIVEPTRYSAKTKIIKLRNQEFIIKNILTTFYDTITFKNSSSIEVTSLEAFLLNRNLYDLVILDDCIYTGEDSNIVNILKYYERIDKEIIFINSLDDSSSWLNKSIENIFTHIFNFNFSERFIRVYCLLKNELFDETSYGFDYIGK